VLSFFAMKPSRLETMCKVTHRPLVIVSLWGIFLLARLEIH
jgi:hypothetical protein